MEPEAIGAEEAIDEVPIRPRVGGEDGPHVEGAEEDGPQISRAGRAAEQAQEGRIQEGLIQEGRIQESRIQEGRIPEQHVPPGPDSEVKKL